MRVSILAAVVVALLMVAGPASAHYVYQLDFTREFGGNKCLKQRSETSHGDSMGGYSAADAWAFVTTILPYPGSCSTTVTAGWNRAPGGLRVKLQLWKRYSAGWGLCAVTSWKGLSSKGWHVSAHHYWSRPCGSGYYTTRAFGEIRYNGHWVKGRLWSGSHYL